LIEAAKKLLVDLRVALELKAHLVWSIGRSNDLNGLFFLRKLHQCLDPGFFQLLNKLTFIITEQILLMALDCFKEANQILYLDVVFSRREVNAMRSFISHSQNSGEDATDMLEDAPRVAISCLEILLHEAKVLFYEVDRGAQVPLPGVERVERADGKTALVVFQFLEHCFFIC
jgi:hypothetical protein